MWKQPGPGNGSPAEAVERPKIVAFLRMLGQGNVDCSALEKVG
jgi:hypothetical protein